MSESGLAQYKIDFIHLLVRAGILTFGDFTTKSGRRTPYFINTGNFCTGRQIEALGTFYAEAIEAALGDGYDNLYGPAYKGIPLVVTTSSGLWRTFQRDVSYTFNRKEVKDHGEGGSLVGHKYRGGERVVIVEDVVTAGTSIDESVPILRAAAPDLDLVAVVVSVDRQERGQTERTALAEIESRYGMRTFAICTIDEIVAYLRDHDIDGKRLLDDDLLTRIAAYRAEYGAV